MSQRLVINQSIFSSEGFNLYLASNDEKRGFRAIYSEFLKSKTQYDVEGFWSEHPKYGEQFKITCAVATKPEDRRSMLKYLCSFPNIGIKRAESIAQSIGDDIQNIENISSVAGISDKIFSTLKNTIVRELDVEDLKYKLMKRSVPNRHIRDFEKLFNSLGKKEFYKIDPFKNCKFDVGVRVMDLFGIDKDHISYRQAQLLDLMKREQLIGNTYSIMEIDEDVRESLLNDGEIVIEENRCYISRAHAAEVEVARVIKELMTIPAQRRQYRDPGFIEFTEEQNGVIENISNSRVSILSGAGGCGKSEIVKSLCVGNFHLLAFTGVAVRRLRDGTGETASTIHRFMKNGWLNKDEDYVFIIDEFSMVDLELFDKFLSHSLSMIQISQMHLVMVGDLCQLPSIGHGNVLYDLSPHVPVFELTKNFRQEKGSVLARHLMDVRNGIKPELRTSGDFYFYKYGEIDISSLYREIVKVHGVDDVQVLCPYRKGGGCNEWNNTLKKMLKLEEDKIMVIKNNYDVGVFNGDVGRRIKFLNSEYSLCRIQNSELKILNEELDLNYAQTIHKSQGQQYKIVILIIPSNSPFITKNLLYTGMSRARKELHLISLNRVIKNAVNNDRLLERNSHLQGRISNYQESDF